MPTLTNPPTYQDTAPSRSRASAPRYINMMLAIWLFISAFAWPHALVQRTNTWIVAVFMLVVTLVAVGQPKARYWNTAASIYLFISTILMPSILPGTVWNNLLVAIAVFLVSLTPSSAGSGRRYART